MSEAGDRIRARRLHLGMSIDDLAREAGVSPDTLGDFEAGKRRPRALTMSKVVAGLERIEEGAGIDPRPAVPAESGGLIEFELSGNFGVHLVVKGTVADADVLKRQVVDIIREISR